MNTNQTQEYTWTKSGSESWPIYQRVNFISLNGDFKFKNLITFTSNRSLLITYCSLIFNNGATVPISVCHQKLVNDYLNQHSDKIKKKTVFSIDHVSQTLVCSGKMNGVKSQAIANKWIKIFEDEMLSSKRSIITLMAVIGIPIDSEPRLMRQILLQKKKLKNNLMQVLILEKDGIYNPQTSKMSLQNSAGVIYYGQNEAVQIVETEQKPEDKDKKKKKIEGGYFTIDSSNFKIKDNITGRSQDTVLAVKTLKDKRKGQQANVQKLKKQLKIVESIEDKTFLIKYYCNKNNEDNILMQKYDHSLQEYIYYVGDSLEIEHKIIIAKQVVESVMSLHQSGVVHRDIKPSNFLIDDSLTNTKLYMLKIIDFAESYSNCLQYFPGDYGCSHPYSPLECTQKRSFENNKPQQGLGNKQIDYWSVGVTLYELFFRKLPLSFSRAFLIDISASWKSELLLAIDQREKYGFSLVEDIITIICVKTLKFNQKDRMNLNIIMEMLKVLQNYVINLKTILKHAK